MKILILMCGIPASGKSTTAHFLQQSMGNAPIVSMDDIREELFGTRKYQKQGGLVYSLSVGKTIRLLQERDIVIYDATNRTRKARKKLVETIQKYYDCLAYCVFMDTPLEIALERNANRDKSIQVPPAVIHRMFDTLEAPREENEEYFKEIYIIYPKIFDKNKEMWYNILTKQMAIIPPRRYL